MKVTAGALIVAGATAIASGILLTTFVRAAREEPTQGDLQRLARLDATTDLRLLQARSGLSANNDELADAQRALREELARATKATLLGRMTDDDAENGDDVDMRAAMDALRKGIVEKERKADQILSRAALVRNSAAYLPTVLGELPPALDDARRAMAAAALQASVARTPTALAAAAAALHDLEGKDGKDKSKLGDAEGSAILHVRTIVNETPFVDRLTREYLAIDTTAALEKLTKSTEALRVANLQAQRTTLALLGAALVVTVALVVFLLLRLSRTTKSALRFVPTEFLRLLGTTLQGLKRGDSQLITGSVLFADIRDFTAMSEQRTPEENFSFMNEYLGAMEPAIQAQRGFVNQYLGDGIMALFPNDADDALRAAIAMHRQLRARNQQRNEAVRIGVGINSGRLMLGTVGSNERLNPGVISDAVNLASRMEALTKRYKVDLIISENTYLKLRRQKDFTVRQLDRICVRGSDRPLIIYEVCDVDDDARLAKKQQAAEIYDGGFRHWLGGRFAEAARHFREAQQIVGDDDPVLQNIIAAADRYAATPPASWSGVTDVEESARAALLGTA